MLNIIYADDWFCAVDKPAGQLVHPADNPQEGDEVTMKILRDQLGQQVYNVHRIDRPTTGVLLFGTDRDAARALHRALEAHAVRKTYLAIVYGQPPAAEWLCDTPLQKDEAAPLREALTSFRLLETHAQHSIHLLECVPESGRFHQIRRHLASQDLPIVGDYRYAGIELSDRLGEMLGTGSRMLLQSRSLQFDHPITGEKVTITAPDDPCFEVCFPHR